MDKATAIQIRDRLNSLLSSDPFLKEFKFGVGSARYTNSCWTAKLTLLEAASAGAAGDDAGVNPEWIRAFQRKCYMWGVPRQDLGTRVGNWTLVGAMKAVRDPYRAPLIVKNHIDHTFHRMSPSQWNAHKLSATVGK